MAALGKLRRSGDISRQSPDWAESVFDCVKRFATHDIRGQFLRMELIYPINFMGHDEWLNSGYDPSLSQGEFITRDGEVIGTWRAVDYDPDDEFSGGCFEFVAFGDDAAKFVEGFSSLDIRMSRGFALSTLTRTIREWYEASNPEIS